MKPEALLFKLDGVASLLDDFSFEELDTEQAKALKVSFEHFRRHLQKLVDGEEVPQDPTCEGHSRDTQALHIENDPGHDHERSLIANVSHELRTPLNGIIGFTDLLLEDDLNSLQQERVKAIQSASHALIGLIGELLEYSKLSAGLERFEEVDFHFGGLVRDIVYLCNTLIIREKVSLALVIDPDIPEVLRGDPAKLSQVLLNLLGNAIKFVEEGTIHLSILLKNRSSSDKLVIEFTIADTGIGIAEEQLPFIFDPFHQGMGKTSKSYGGTGLGLSIARQIITQLKGSIAVSSTLGMGSTFTLSLPFEKGDRTKLRKHNTNKQHYGDAAKLVRDCRILVFEDNPLNQHLVEERLKNWGCKVFVTDSGKFGIELLKTERIDIVLMDLRMPHMDGFEISRNIRAHEVPAVRQLPIIALTADVTIADKMKSGQSGINDYLLKPYSPDELLLKLIANKDIMEINTDRAEQTVRLVSAQGPESKAFSLDHIFEDCLRQVELLEELVRLFKQNVLEFIGAVKHQLAKEDFDALDFSLHKVSSGLTQMQTWELQSIVAQMDSCCKSDRDLKHLNFLFDCFVAEYPKIQLAMESELNRLKEQ